MGTVTISASYGARGEMIAKAVAERLGLPFLDRAIPLAVARQLHLSEDSAEAHDERVPSRWERLFSAFSGSGQGLTAVGLSAAPFESPETFRIATEEVIRQAAGTSGAVILGRAGMVVLDGWDDVLRVRLDGPVEARIAQAIADGAEEASAREAQRDVDGARQYYAHFFYKVRQDDIRLYQLVIDSTALPVATCVDLVVRAAEARFSMTSGTWS